MADNPFMNPNAPTDVALNTAPTPGSDEYVVPLIYVQDGSGAEVAVSTNAI